MKSSANLRWFSEWRKQVKQLFSVTYNMVSTATTSAIVNVVMKITYLTVQKMDFLFNDVVIDCQKFVHVSCTVYPFNQIVYCNCLVVCCRINTK